MGYISCLSLDKNMNLHTLNIPRNHFETEYNHLHRYMLENKHVLSLWNTTSTLDYADSSSIISYTLPDMFGDFLYKAPIIFTLHDNNDEQIIDMNDSVICDFISLWEKQIKHHDKVNKLHSIIVSK